MEKEDARKQSREVLHERRKQVIRLHRKGVGVMQIVEQTGLSWSGVNTALRLFEQGGAAALKPKATLNKPSKISAQTWMTQFFGLLCLSRGPFGQFAGR